MQIHLTKKTLASLAELQVLESSEGSNLLLP
jgi:hypothetical protein